MLTCQRCGAHFDSVKSTTRFCSDTCRVAAHRAATKARLEEAVSLLSSITSAGHRGEADALTNALGDADRFLARAAA